MKKRAKRYTVQVSSETVRRLAILKKNVGITSKFLVDSLVEKYFKER